MDLNDGRGWKSFEVHARHVDIKGSSGEVTDGNEERVFRNWKKGDPYYKVAKYLTKPCLCFNVLWKVEQSDEITHDEIDYLAEISKQSVGVVWFLLTSQSKKKRKSKLKKQF